MNTNFSRQLIKGKIAEIIFEQMFSETGEFTIIPFGSGFTMPDLPRVSRTPRTQQVLDTIRNAPDFAIISKDKKDVSLVEVRFRSRYHNRDIKKLAQKQIKKWDPSLLFIATLDKFYLDYCSRIVKNNGRAAGLSYRIIKKDVQERYLELVREFEQ